MSSIPELFAKLPALYRPGSLSEPTVYYFSVGEHKYTLTLEPDTCTVERGKTTDNADVVLKTTPELFTKMVVHGGTPGTLDIVRGRVKTNNPAKLKQLRQLFDFSSL